MALKPKISKTEFDALHEAIRGEYREENGAFVLSVEGMAPANEVIDLKTKIAEFRDTNTALIRAIGLEPTVPATEAVTKAQEFRKKYEGIDPEEYKTIKTEYEALKAKGVGKPDDVSLLIRTELEKAVKPLQTEIETWRTTATEAQKRADQSAFRERIQAVAAKHKVRANSLRHVLRDAEEKFELRNGEIKPKDGVRHPADPLKEFTPDEWLQELSRSDDYLFEPSNGSGARTGTDSGRSGARELVNPTPEEKGRHMDDIASGKVVVVYRQ